MATIGIDLGTTYSAAAICRHVGDVRVIPNIEGQDITPSVVFFPETDSGDEEPLVGMMAKNSAASAPQCVVRSIKRMMGDKDFCYYSPNGHELRPEVISAFILKHIKKYVEVDLGEAVTDAVITVPAYFDDVRRTATKQAGRIAGLNVLQVFNEPTAVALAYGIGLQDVGRILVYDLGGGTFDVTLMHVHDGEFDVIATDGDPELGGDDFDREITRLVVADLARQGYVVDEDNEDILCAEIEEKAEILKRGLSNVPQSTAMFTIDGKNYRVRITREQFEQATHSLLERTRERTEILLESQHLNWADIDRLLMAGGSTRMPMVRQMLQQISGKSIGNEVNQDTAVSMGAAIYAKYLETENGRNTDERSPASVREEAPSIRISDVTSQSLGIVAKNPKTGEPENSIIIQRNTHIPAKYSDTYCTTIDNQRSINIQVTEGNDPELEYVRIVGEKTLPIPPHPKHSPIKVTIAYDIDQTVYVEVTDLVTDGALGTFEIDRADNLSEPDVQSLKKSVEGVAID